MNIHPTLHFPTGITPEYFLAEYWQTRPLLIRQGITDFHCPLSPEELAWLSFEEEVESRIVLEKDGCRPWEARFGPFDETDFSSLPASHWTLLVQDVDKHVPDVAKLLDYFPFLPQWRLDDVMISYAPDQGSVGPHIDDYDVFLFQVQGNRHWKIHTRPVADDDFIPGLDLRILPVFEAEEEWLLEPGDILYLPPNVAHWGIAEGDGCMTCSVGFRAPSYKELISDWCDYLIEEVLEDGRIRDAPLRVQKHPGEILQSAIAHLREEMQQQLKQDAGTFSDWFGRLMTRPKPHLEFYQHEEKIEQETSPRGIDGSGRFYRNGLSRFAFMQGEVSDILYVNGSRYKVSKSLQPLLALLTEAREFTSEQLGEWLKNRESSDLLTKLTSEGHLIFAHEND